MFKKVVSIVISVLIIVQYTEKSNIYYLVNSTSLFRRLLWRRNMSHRLDIQLTQLLY